MQWVFVGLTGAFAIAGGVLLYKGYLASEGNAECVKSRTPNFPYGHGIFRRNHCGVRVLRRWASEGCAAARDTLGILPCTVPGIKCPLPASQNF